MASRDSCKDISEMWIMQQQPSKIPVIIELLSLLDLVFCFGPPYQCIWTMASKNPFFSIHPSYRDQAIWASELVFCKEQHSTEVCVDSSYLPSIGHPNRHLPYLTFMYPFFSTGRMCLSLGFRKPCWWVSSSHQMWASVCPGMIWWVFLKQEKNISKRLCRLQWHWADLQIYIFMSSVKGNLFWDCFGWLLTSFAIQGQVWAPSLWCAPPTVMTAKVCMTLCARGTWPVCSTTWTMRHLEDALG